MAAFLAPSTIGGRAYLAPSIPPAPVRAVVLTNGVLAPITDAQVSTGIKPIVYTGAFNLQQRQTTEGTPVVFQPDGNLRLLQSGETLIL